MVGQWVWNLRLELGHHLHSDPVRTTEFAAALPPASTYIAPSAGYAPPHIGVSWKALGLSGSPPDPLQSPDPYPFAARPPALSATIGPTFQEPAPPAFGLQRFVASRLQ